MGKEREGGSKLGREMAEEEHVRGKIGKGEESSR